MPSLQQQQLQPNNRPPNNQWDDNEEREIDVDKEFKTLCW